jgi:hypothetical protein
MLPGPRCSSEIGSARLDPAIPWHKPQFSVEGFWSLNNRPLTVPEDVNASGFQRHLLPDRSTIDVLTSVAVTAHSVSPVLSELIH